MSDKNKIRVAVSGYFDPIHVGHLEYLRMAKELGEYGIRVNAVSPGLIDTEIHAKAGDAKRVQKLMPSVPLSRVGSAKEVADTVLWLLSSKSSYVCGTIVKISGGRWF